METLFGLSEWLSEFDLTHLEMLLRASPYPWLANLAFLCVDPLLSLAAMCMGFAVFYATFFVTGLTVKSKQIGEQQKNSADYDIQQLVKIREKSFVFRNFEPLVRDFEVKFRNDKAIDQFEHYLDLKGMLPPWNASLFLAVKKTEAVIFGIVVSCLLPFYAGINGVIFGPLFGLAYYSLIVDSFKSEALNVKRRIIYRLPFAIDIMALVRLGSGSFVDSIRTVAEETTDHPIGEVFNRAYNDSKFGKTQRDVLESLAERMRDPSFDELSFAIMKADELGRPIADALAEQAAQMRLNRQQWGEKASGEAQVKIIYPGLVIMLACLLIIISPFILEAIRSSGAI